MTKRKSISSKLRFEIFKRDSFTCQYCGNHPPQVKLHIDHITAVATGGGNEEDNLITSCESCNLGKGARPLSVAMKGLAEKAADVAEREKQLKGYQAITKQRRERIEDEVWQIIAIFPRDDKLAPLSFRRDWFLSIQRFVERLGFDEVLDAMDIAVSKKPYGGNQTFRYFCGVCWSKVREASHVE